MASPQKKEETLKKIIQNSSIRFICPLCLKGFPRGDVLYRHFREQQDDKHAGLGKRTSKKKADIDSFFACYQELVRTPMAAESIPPGPNCFEVDFVVKNFGSSEHTLNTSETIEGTLKKIIQNSRIRFICPPCLKGFPRIDVLSHHFREQQEQGDDTHAGLAMKDRDHFTFFLSYRVVLGTSMTARDIPRGPECFSTAFVVEHYEEVT
ncbi:uncharacterized protein LDX57_007869 [Aspergillus melleus]|uniref:uncharacterized protein n=1 Tax=Aspergillus melleus TaxID=138277 RepID=UPI001E8D6AF9|nr:uncharacterized protein LDX57_007869 [Aspergillus melleus]KAH8430200.1 hypothetical protein LDX57_007869 [Aspergillus melleus]